VSPLELGLFDKESEITEELLNTLGGVEASAKSITWNLVSTTIGLTLKNNFMLPRVYS